MRRSLIVLMLLALPCFSVAQGVSYYQGDVYAALLQAKKEHKALLVECYAGWNSKSRWMNEMINRTPKVRDFIRDNFIIWQTDTETPAGAKFAVDYKVNDYPSIFVFNTSGSVVNKIDRAMEADDFIRELEEDLFTLDGGNLWKLEQLEKAAQSGDREKADEMFFQYIQKVGRDNILSKSHRWVFSDHTITFFGSTSFFFMTENRKELSSNPSDSVEIDGAIYTAIYDEMVSMLLSETSCDSSRVDEVSGFAQTLLPRNAVLPLFPDTIKALASSDYDTFLDCLSTLISAVPEEDGPSLACTLSAVSRNGTVGQKARARSIVRRLMDNSKDPSISGSLQVLYNSL